MASAGLGRWGRSILEVEHPQGRSLTPSNRVIMMMMIGGKKPII
jgi:hypothetical protein